MADDIPQWALERACELRVKEPADTPITAERLAELARRSPQGYATVKAFARYIAAHEEPPADPALEATKRALRDAYGGAAPEFVSAFLTALAFEGFQIAKIVEADQ